MTVETGLTVWTSLGFNSGGINEANSVASRVGETGGEAEEAGDVVDCVEKAITLVTPSDPPALTASVEVDAVAGASAVLVLASAMDLAASAEGLEDVIVAGFKDMCVEAAQHFFWVVLSVFFFFIERFRLSQ